MEIWAVVAERSIEREVMCGARGGRTTKVGRQRSAMVVETHVCLLLSMRASRRR